MLIKEMYKKLGVWDIYYLFSYGVGEGIPFRKDSLVYRIHPWRYEVHLRPRLSFDVSISRIVQSNVLRGRRKSELFEVLLDIISMRKFDNPKLAKYFKDKYFAKKRILKDLEEILGNKTLLSALDKFEYIIPLYIRNFFNIPVYLFTVGNVIQKTRCCVLEEVSMIVGVREYFLLLPQVTSSRYYIFDGGLAPGLPSLELNYDQFNSAKMRKLVSYENLDVAPIPALRALTGQLPCSSAPKTKYDNFPSYVDQIFEGNMLVLLSRLGSARHFESLVDELLPEYSLKKLECGCKLTEEELEKLGKFIEVAGALLRTTVKNDPPEVKEEYLLYLRSLGPTDLLASALLSTILGKAPEETTHRDFIKKSKLRPYRVSVFQSNNELYAAGLSGGYVIIVDRPLVQSPQSNNELYAAGLSGGPVFWYHEITNINFREIKERVLECYHHDS